MPQTKPQPDLDAACGIAFAIHHLQTRGPVNRVWAVVMVIVTVIDAQVTTVIGAAGTLLALVVISAVVDVWLAALRVYLSPCGRHLAPRA